MREVLDQGRDLGLQLLIAVFRALSGQLEDVRDASPLNLRPPREYDECYAPDWSRQ
jgi:hypothetical protein